MQRLTVEMLCNQLDNTWKYFTATFKMQAKSQLGFHFICEVRGGQAGWASCLPLVTSRWS